MVEPLSQAASAQDVEIYYAHAAVMFEFLNRLCLGLEPCATADLVHALTEGGVAPDELFLWATAQRGNELIEQDAIRFWLDYESHHNFRPEILDRLLSRTRSSQEGQNLPLSPGQSKR